MPEAGNSPSWLPIYLLCLVAVVFSDLLRPRQPRVIQPIPRRPFNYVDYVQHLRRGREPGSQLGTPAAWQ